jgi:predicted protein tyrosine phosphatase
MLLFRGFIHGKKLCGIDSVWKYRYLTRQYAVIMQETTITCMAEDDKFIYMLEKLIPVVVVVKWTEPMVKKLYSAIFCNL